MRLRCAVAPADVGVRTDPALLGETPAPLEERFSLLPERVQRALRAGLRGAERDFHLFVAAPPETSFEADVLTVVRRAAAELGPPDDLVYVHDFDAPDEPRPLTLPAGRAADLQAQLGKALRGLRAAVAALGRAEEQRAHERSLAKALEARSREAMASLEARARELGFGVRHVQGGVQTFPILHGKPVSSEQFHVLDEATRKALTEAEEKLSEAVDDAAARVRAMTDEIEQQRDASQQQAAERLIEREMAGVIAGFQELPDVVRFLERVRGELAACWRDLDDTSKQDAAEREARLRVFAVNVLVSSPPPAPASTSTSNRGAGPPPVGPDSSSRDGDDSASPDDDDEAGAPVVFERDPRPQRLFGRVERRLDRGMLHADLGSIRAGSLLRASGGYLVLRAHDILSDPDTWQTFKRTLDTGENDFEGDVGPLAALTTPLRPQPAPISTRVVLIGDEGIFISLVDQDPDFSRLFRIKVEVEPDIARTQRGLEGLDAFLMSLAQSRGWLPFDRGARARLLDLATRNARDREHLSLLLPPLEETAAFASEGARERDAPVVSARDVDAAWQDRRDRTSSASRVVREQVLNGELLIETTGRRKGVVNGLAVVSVNDVHFGQPLRITAVVSPGTEGLVDVEREAHLGGDVHTKGVAILRGILSLLFGQERPLSLRAQITFEQSYGEVDGDSASSAELFAILSALADVGIDQGIAVTGSVNQLGEMQAIGGVCAKIEGFFDLCAARGLTGEQGVLLPRSNVRHLVLRDDVTDAIASGRFHLYAIGDVWQGIEVLSDLPAGVRDADGRFPAESVFGRVERRLIELAERLRGAETPARDAMSDIEDDAQP